MFNIFKYFQSHLGVQIGVQRVAISRDGWRLVYVASDPTGQPRLYSHDW
jgi:hypothetical protein